MSSTKGSQLEDDIVSQIEVDRVYEDNATIPRSDVKEVVAAVLNDLYSEHSRSNAALLERSSSRGSQYSNRSRPLSRKTYQAPQPPPISTVPSRRSSVSSKASHVSSKVPQKKSCKGKCQDIWSTPAKRRQCLIWSLFGLMVFFTLLLVLIMVVKFTTGFPSSIEDNVKEDSTEESPALEEHLFMLIGGYDEEGHDSTEIYTRLGPCLLPDGYPAILPLGLKGHMVALAKNQVILCGGRSVVVNKIGRSCWSYSKSSNHWVEIPGLRVPLGYGAAAALNEHVYFMGGMDNEKRKSPKVQVFYWYSIWTLKSYKILNVKSYAWETGPSLPHPVWGHCAVTSTDGQIIVAGGWTMRAVRTGLKKTMRLMRSGKDWEMYPLMKVGRATHACTATNYAFDTPVVLVAGGMDYFHAPVRSVEMLILNEDEPRWVSLPDLMEPRAWYPTLGVLGNHMVLINGKGPAGFPRDTAQKYQAKAKNWTMIEGRTQLRRADGRGVLIPVTWFPNCLR
ncbi:hypothetical protein TCAL_08142 [Tigriopus californicus]|uniref:Uncharacterized protein n=1 Tax=Tigriopus californicus TaxID=6832 RepID=A0A553P413_TIGCA|nr:hypothetical protein TCAL_08142 [Tigriopus californicus]